MRRMPIAAVAAAVLFLSTACGGDTESTDDPAAPSESAATGAADLLIWTDDLKLDAVKKIGDEFAAENGIVVDVQAVTELQATFVTANNAGNGPDVVVGAHDWIGNLVQNGAIEPLQLTPDQLSGYSESAVRAATYDGKLYGLPYGVEAIALYRNTDVAADEVATLDEAFDIGDAAKKAGKVDSAFNLQQGELGDAYHMQPVLTSMGGYLFGVDSAGSYDPTDLGIGEAGSLAAANKIGELGEKGRKILSRSISGDNSIALFAAGKAAYLVSGPWALKDIQAAGINYAIQPIPGFEGEDPAKPFMGAQTFMVAGAGKNKTFAQEFVTGKMNSEASMQIMFDLAKLPPAMTAVRESIKAANPESEIFALAAEGGEPMPSIPAMSAVWEPLGKAYAAIIGGADPEKTMTDAGNTIATAIGG